MPQPILLSTLGSEPQVVTIALHLLQQRGIPIHQVVVIHTAPRAPVIGAALEELRAAFAIPPLDVYPLTLEPLTMDGLPLDDIATERQAQATFCAIYQIVKRLKSGGAELHYCLSGGRKVMAIYSLAVAQLLFDPHDALYYLISEGELLRTRRLLPLPGDHVQLVSVPFLRWTADAALLADLMRYDDPLEAVQRGSELARQNDLRRAETFCRHVLTHAEEAVVALVVREGLSNDEIGSHLGRSPKTVANQLSSIYAKLAEYLGRDESQRVDRHTLISWLHAYYAGRGE